MIIPETGISGEIFLWRAVFQLSRQTATARELNPDSDMPKETIRGSFFIPDFAVGIVARHSKPQRNV